MNLSYFIANRISKQEYSSFGSFIIRLAIVSVALSIAVMVLSNALVLGFKNQIKSKIFDFWGHIQIFPPNYNQASEPKPLELSQSLIDSIKDVKQVQYTQDQNLLGFHLGNKTSQTQGGVSHIHSYVQLPGILSAEGQIEGLVLKGISQDYDFSFLTKYLTQGKAELSCPDSCRKIIISASTAERMNLKIGQPVVIYFVKNGEQIGRKFLISAIYSTGLEEYDKKIAIVDASVLQQILGWSSTQVSGYEIFIDHLEDLNPINEHLYDEILPMNVSNSTIQSKLPGIFEWLSLQDYNEVVILGLMIAVCLINMATVLIIFILNRMKMIGILKTLGMRNRKISTIFLIQSSKIILKGLLLGNLIGLSLAWLQYHFKWIKLNEKDYYLSIAPIEFSWSNILLINSCSAILILLFLLIPSWVVSRISPVKSISFD